MSRLAEGISAEDSFFDEVTRWHARWKDVSDLGLPPEEVDRWVEWSKVPENKKAFDAVAFVSRAKYALKPPPLPTAEELATDDSDDVVFLPPSTTQSTDPRLALKWWRRVAFLAIAAAIAAISFIPLMRLLNLDAAEPVHVVSTKAGQVKRIVLSDGSKVTLGAKTELSVHYGQCLRTILLDSGEALFDVVHDPQCPFIVIAGSGAITALGTQFSVRRTLDRVTVEVAEGSVAVQPRDTLVSVPWPQDQAKSQAIANIDWSDAKLTRGQEVTYAGAQKRSAVTSEDPHVAAAWLDGRRIYRHEPLSYLVADISRYFEEPIEVDPEVADLQFTGLVYQSQVKKFLEDLEIVFPVKISRTESNHILILPRTGTDDAGLPPRSALTPQERSKFLTMWSRVGKGVV